jgi:hypothetical protein
MKLKQAGSGCVGDICKSYMLSREMEKMRMQNFCTITKILQMMLS